MNFDQKEVESQVAEKARALGFKVARELSESEIEEVGGGIKALETDPGYVGGAPDTAY